MRLGARPTSRAAASAAAPAAAPGHRLPDFLLATLVVVAMGAAASATPAAAAAASAGAAATRPASARGVVFPPGVDKLGAGLLLCRVDKAGGEPSILLLKRTSKHHGGAWGLPGGNAEPGDASLLATAARESVEELGAAGAPPYVVKARLDTRRGKRGQKVFAVFVGLVEEGDAAGYAPVLNEEHSEHRWWRASDVASAAALAAGNGGGVGGVGGGGGGGGGKAKDGGEELHPVVVLAMHEAGGVAGLKKLLALV